MKRLLIVTHLLLILSLNCLAQENIFFKNSGDSAIIYLSSIGGISNQKDAAIYRVTKFENNLFAFKGRVNDYFIKNGKQALKGNYVNGLLEGPFTTYYVNGKIKESGYYQRGKRDSIWCFYYENGNIEKKILYKNDFPRLMEYYKKNGKPVFTDGNGEYEGECNTNGNLVDFRKIKGKVKDGLMVDRWTIYIYNNTSTEVFENGKFIRGKDDHNRTYDDFGLITLTGFPYYDHVDLTSLNSNDDKGYHWPSYDKNMDIIASFIDKFRLKIISNDNLDKNGFFYGLFEFRVEAGKVLESSFKQITNDPKSSNEVKQLIISMNKWDDQPSFTCYLPVIWEKNKIYLLPNDYIKK